MSTRASARLAWGLCGLAIALHLVGAAFVVAGIGIGTPGDADIKVSALGFLIAFWRKETIHIAPVAEHLQRVFVLAV